ncbi:superoxide dismutase [Nitratiruptor sp. YY09-18]|uniref:superoxide dismutase n=1 Tax=Nitratiruptor sp. YY09-18 TaxID=2724901 RepID=UPI0019169871|nr:superoxide dismutase [Nitratiruptor sp. YY09-18]BCD67411.1 superoxide dismutase, Fe-Mn family [Nitratiruptor sp. YY09-18]
MQHLLPDLPFAYTALEPFLSQETLHYHHDKHHAGYVKKLNALIQGTQFEDLPLKEIIQKADGAIFNNAAQTFNHNLYWHCLSPQTCSPSKEFEEKIIYTFGGMELFKEQFIQAALNNFGCGWTWLTMDEKGNLHIENTTGADTPLRYNKTPLLTIDVWEHAYYLDYKNERGKYLENFYTYINWESASNIFANANYLDTIALEG